MKIRKPVFLIILWVTIFGLYWPSLKYPFIWDDKVLFDNNPFFVENQSFSSALTSSYFRKQVGLGSVDFYYRPFLMASFWIENRIWGIHPVSLRLVNLIIFLAALSAWYLFLKKRYDFSSFPEITTTLFALFPIHVDNIVWIVGRSDLLLLLFSGLCFIFLDRYIRTNNKYFLVFCSFFFALGIYSKESFMFFLPILIIAEYQLHKKINFMFHAANTLIVASYFLIKGPLLHIRDIPILWPKGIFSFVVTAIGPIGYYTKVIIFSFGGPRFLSSVDLNKPVYFLWASLGLLALLTALFLSRKRQSAFIPGALIFFFFIGHSALIFSQLFPYRAYARYMIIPALGFLWLLCQGICQLKEKFRSALVFILLLLFIPRVVILSRDYRHEIIFWQKAVDISPHDPHATFQLASALFRQKNYIDAELVLNQTLFMKMPREVALLVSLLYSDLELVRANYQHVFRWLDSIEALSKQIGGQPAPYMQIFIRAKRAATQIALGYWQEAENLFLENIRTFPEMRENYRELYSLYLGQEKWADAISLEKIMKERFPKEFAELNTLMIKEELSNFSLDEKINFYELHRNYPSAIKLLENKRNETPLDVKTTFHLARLYLKNGRAEKAREIFQKYIENNPSSVELINKIAFFYINEFHRVREALWYLQRSLELDQTQVEIKYIIMRLTESYLKRLKPVWPEEKIEKSD